MPMEPFFFPRSESFKFVVSFALIVATASQPPPLYRPVGQSWFELTGIRITANRFQKLFSFSSSGKEPVYSETASDKDTVTMSPETLTMTVLRAQAGDRDAFDTLVIHFESRVYGIVMQRLRNTAEADEVTQEVFLRAFRKLSQLKEAEAFAGWLCQIAARLSINRAVRRPPETACEPESFALMREAPDNPEEDLVRAEDAQQLRVGLDRLGDLDRATLFAFYFEGQSLKEMSESFDSPIGTIKRRLHTARNRLREVLTALQPA